MITHTLPLLSSPLPAPAMAPPDWSTLPADAISVISSLISDDADHAHFRSVCTSFRSAAPNRPHLPWLLFAHSIDTLALQLFNFPSHVSSSPPLFPEGLTSGKFLCGSSLGWIALLDDAPGISLHNPFTGAQTRLPPLTGLSWVTKSDRGFIHDNRTLPFRDFTAGLASKLVLSSDNPTAADNIVLVISNFGKSLICCRPGDTYWTTVPPFLGPRERIDDIVHYNHKFYAVWSYSVFVVDIGPHSAIVHKISLPLNGRLFSNGKNPKALFPPESTYLLVSSGDLLLVSSTFAVPEAGQAPFSNAKLCFEVFRVDLDFSDTSNRRFSLFMMDNLGGRSLFVGSSGSMSVSAGTSPWCSGNCIYFILKGTQRKDAVAVYFMEDGSIGLLLGFDPSVETIAYCDFSWFAPRLC